MPQHFADNGLAGELLPPAHGLAIIHNEIGIAEKARGAEVQRFSGDAPVEDNGRIAERAIGDGDRPASHSVIDYFVPDQDL